MAKRKRDWIDCTQADVAACLGVSTNTVAAWAQKGMPGSRGRYRVPEIVAWLLATGPWSPKQKSDDPLLDADGDSPGLERYRLAKAALAELELQQRIGQLISCERNRGILARWAAIYRRLGERLGKRFGHEAANAFSDATAECQRILDHELDSDQLTDSGPPQ